MSVFNSINEETKKIASLLSRVSRAYRSLGEHSYGGGGIGLLIVAIKKIILIGVRHTGTAVAVFFFSNRGHGKKKTIQQK